MNQKYCYCCKQVKQIEYFSKDKSRRDGYSNKCKDCRKLTKSIIRDEFINISEKKCSKCNLTKPVYQFRRNSRTSDGYTSQCKNCQKCNEKLKQRHNTTSRKSYLEKRRHNNIILCKNYVIEYLKSHPCADCGFTNIICLDFDHIDPNTKDKSISTLTMRGTCLQRLINEIKKCIVRCANCHRLRTSKQFNFWKEII